MDDSRIVELYLKRDEKALSETSVKYGRFLGFLAMNVLSVKEDAEECVNDTWLQAWNAIPPQRPQSLKHFLARITRNLSFNRWKSQSAEKRSGHETALVLDELAECLESETDVESDAK